MCATPGTNYSDRVVANDPNLIRVTIGTKNVSYTIADNGNGNYTITVDGAKIVPPGPMVISGLAGGNQSVTVYA
jgi:hypothetical protein